MIARPMSGSASSSQRDGGRTRDDAERDEGVAARVLAVGDERRAREPLAGTEPDPRGELVADEADDACGGERPEVGELLRVDEAADGLVERDAGGDEDRQHDGVARQPLAAGGTEEERDAERDGGQGVARVVDQVREQRDRARDREDRRLHERCDRKDAEADRDRAHSGARADDRRVDEAVGVAAVTAERVRVLVRLRRGHSRAGRSGAAGT